MKVGLAVAAGGALLRVFGSTWRIEWCGSERLAEARRRSPGGNVIFAIWHSSLAILAFTHRYRRAQVLVSQHQDGEIIARIVASLGFGLVRGSSRRGGRAALFAMTQQLEAGLDVAITVDGPVGPRYSVHPGVLLLARRTGRPIVPVIPTASRCAFLPTWDALRLPSPGARVRVQHGAAQFVSPQASAADIAAAQMELESTLKRWTASEEAVHGREVGFEDIQDRRGYFEIHSERDRPLLWLRGMARLHEVALHVDRRVRPRPRGRGTRPWVIGVGNLEAGGTGKTPCVIELARSIAATGRRLAVLTRGHGGQIGHSRPVACDPHRLPAAAADETRLLVEALAGAARVVVSRNKRRGLDWLRHEGVDIVLVDDAFQTVGLPVDRHLVLLDWARPLGNGWLLPAGRLREPASGLRRADALLFTRAGGPGLPSRPEWAHLRPERLFRAREVVVGLTRPDGEPIEPEALRGSGVAVLSGIGRPLAFEAMVRRLAAEHGFAVRRTVRVGDHAPLERVLGKLSGRLQALGAGEILLTRKDVLRLPNAHERNEPLLVVEQRLEIEALETLLVALLA